MFLGHPFKPMKALIGTTLLALLLSIPSISKAQGVPNAWGYNFYGALGDGTKTDRHSPVAVANLTNVVQLAEGYDFTLALKSDGTVWTGAAATPSLLRFPG